MSPMTAEQVSQRSQELNKANTPDSLGPAGTKLWESIIEDVAEGFFLDARELALLEKACGCADIIEAVEEALAESTATVVGPHGQTMVHPAIPELRQQRLAMLRLLNAIDFGESDDG